MRIAVFGLGYVGSVTAACLAKSGHQVIGVDTAAEKVRMIQRGEPPVLESGLGRLMAEAVRRGMLRATLDAAEAVRHSRISLVSVGTPARKDGTVNLDAVIRVSREIGRALRAHPRFHVVALRSTVPPGTTEGAVIPVLEKASRRKAGRDFGVCFHPEFLREGSSVRDFFHPPKTVIGAPDSRSARPLATLWKGTKAPLFLTSLRVAEMVKYADNTFHALKVCFANEVGTIARSVGTEGGEVMDIFTADTKLNISPLYLNPGFAFGGACLPKDVRGLLAVARQQGLALPLLENILPSNLQHLRRAVETVLSTGKKRIGVLGLVFKPGTDDLRESPACGLVKALLGVGRDVRIYEPQVQIERLMGANRTFIQRQLPRLPALLVSSLGELNEWSDVIVLTRAGFVERVRRVAPRKIVIDLTQLAESLFRRKAGYLGPLSKGQ